MEAGTSKSRPTSGGQMPPKHTNLPQIQILSHPLPTTTWSDLVVSKLLPGQMSPRSIALTRHTPAPWPRAAPAACLSWVTELAAPPWVRLRGCACRPPSRVASRSPHHDTCCCVCSPRACPVGRTCQGPSSKLRHRCRPVSGQCEAVPVPSAPAAFGCWETSVASPS